MIVAPSVITAAKYGFLTMVVTSAGFLIGNIIVMTHHTVEFADSLIYNPQTSLSLEKAQSVLDKNYGKCLTEPSKSFCLLSAQRRLQLLRSKDNPPATATTPLMGSARRMRHPIHSLLVEFGRIMTHFNVTPVLLEPSMLFCALSPSDKFNLLTKKFNPSKWLGSRQVVTVGILEKDAKVLDQEPAFSATDFQISRSQRWFRRSNTFDVESDQLRTVHYFFTRHSLTVHVVVLFEWNGFLWHAGLSSEDSELRDLLHVKEATFENFTSILLEIENSPELLISLPSDPVQFLYQIQDSEFQECSGNILDDVMASHPSLTPLQLQNRALVGVQELKLLLHHLFIPFWLWAETLEGWLEGCNIFRRTSEFNLAVFHSAVKGLNLTSLFYESNYLKIPRDVWLAGEALQELIFTKFTLDCYGLKINIFICYEEKDSVWSYADTELDKAYRIIRPKFRLCSADMYGQRVHVPCEMSDLKREHRFR